MAIPGKIVLHSLQGYRPELDAIVEQWIRERVKYVGVVGIDAPRIEDVIDDLCVGDGSNSYFMVTVAHSPDETLEDATFLQSKFRSSKPTMYASLSSNHSFEADGSAAAQLKR